VTRNERIEAALATAKNDKEHCPQCGKEYERIIGADGAIWLSCKSCSAMEFSGHDTYSKAICDKASIDLRDEVLALRAQVERQKALIQRCRKVLESNLRDYDLMNMKNDLLPAMEQTHPFTLGPQEIRDALAQIESEEVGR